MNLLMYGYWRYWQRAFCAHPLHWKILVQKKTKWVGKYYDIMKNTFIWLVASLLFTMVGCVEGLQESGVTETSSEQLPNLTAGFAEWETRTYVESGKYLRWHEDDRLTAFFCNTRNRQYKFDGATGDNSGSFSYVSSGNLETGNALDCIYAVYPYDETATITDDGQISLTLPAVQTYAENSFGRGANTMLAVTENVEDTFLGFKNVCGYLKLKLYNAEGATIKSIEVKGNGEEKIAGAATATIAFAEVPQLTMADDATATITIDCGDGVALGTTAETATEFWVVIPETTFEGGITITVTDTEGGIFEKSTTKEVAVERNAIQPMAALGVEFVAPVAKPANNEIWYTSTDGKVVTPNRTNAFGANIVSNTYENCKGIIKFDAPVTWIGNVAFYNCSNIATVTIGDSVTTIGDHAFGGCSSLTSVTIGDSVTTIGDYAFDGCSSLTGVTVPDSVTAIGHNAFGGCSSLTSVTIPDSVTLIVGSPFFNCSSLQEFNGKFASEDGRCLVINGVLRSFAPAGITGYTIPDSITTIGRDAFSGCSSLTSLTIGDSVTEIGVEAFSGCSSLTSLTIGDSVTTIGDYAFMFCSSLTSINIPDSVTTIGEGAFLFCTSLTGITISDSVTTIGDGAFYACSSLTSVYCKPTTPPDITLYNNKWSAFDKSAAGCTIYVPNGSVNAYKSASGWKEYADAIVGYDFQ